MKTIQLHDLVLDLSKHEALYNGEFKDFHNRLIVNYSRKVNNISSSGSDQSSPIEKEAALNESRVEEGTRCFTWWEKIQRYLNVFNDKCTRRREHVHDGSQPISSVVIELKRSHIEQRERKKYTKWWTITHDGYIQENICYLLHQAGRFDELLWLLSQPQWIMFRLLNGFVLEVEGDLKEGISALEKLGTSFEQRGHLQIIGKAVRLCRLFVHEHPSESC